MRLQRPIFKWLLFTACVALFVAAMIWVTQRMCAMDRDHQASEREAQLQERVRLALWRMDSLVNTLLVRENSRPAGHYEPFHSPEDLFSNRSQKELPKGEAVMPSPLLGEPPEFVNLHFQIKQSFACSPQVPMGKDLVLAANWYAISPQMNIAKERLTRLNDIIQRHPDFLPQALTAPVHDPKPAAPPAAAQPAPAEKAVTVLDTTVQAPAPPPIAVEAQQKVAPAQMAANNMEFQQRSKLANDTLSKDNTLAYNGLMLKKKESPAAGGSAGAASSMIKLDAKKAGSDPLASAAKASTSASLDINGRARRAAPATAAPAAAPPVPVARARVIAPATAGEQIEKMAGASVIDAEDSAAVAAAPAPAAPMSETRTTSGRGAQPTPAEGKQDHYAASQPARRQAGYEDREELKLKQDVKLMIASEAASFAAPGDLKPRWMENELFLVRNAPLDGISYVQGLWLDWPRLRTRLLETIGDLLPNAELSATDPAWLDASSMVTLPVRLLPGRISFVTAEASPLHRSLIIAWSCFALAAAAVGLVLHRAVLLSERRGAFVSAVTHELRTPLTTFQLYSEMLADDMVPDTDKRREYLRTLCDESTRLTHLVENVLSYSRIERGRTAARRENVLLSDLVARIEPRLRQRTRQCDLDLQVSVSADAAETRVHVDALAVEQIVFNLVDNACKYAAPDSKKQVLNVDVNVEPKCTTFRVRDHGPGLSRQQLKRLFRPFEKSATEAAHSAPGVGLGLALCRRLARELGGDLVLESNDQGACFKLSVPVSA